MTRIKKKVNPRRKPATMADVERAREQGVVEAVKASMAIFLTVLFDKQGFDQDRMSEVWEQVESLSESVKLGYVSISDLKTVLRDDYDIHLS